MVNEQPTIDPSGIAISASEAITALRATCECLPPYRGCIKCIAAEHLERAHKVLREFADCHLHDGNCASLEVATARIRNLARTVVESKPSDAHRTSDRQCES